MLRRKLQKVAVRVLLNATALACVMTVKAQEIQIINKDLQRRVAQSELMPQDATQWVITSEHVSTVSGVHHIYYRQQLDGIEIYGSEASVHKAQNGKIVASHNNFVRDAGNSVYGSRNAQIDAIQALNAAARQLGYGGAGASIKQSAQGIDKRTVLRASSISRSDVPARLMYHYSEKYGLRLTWDLSIESKATVNWWNVRVDATTGEILDKIDWTVQCNSREEHVHDLGSAPATSNTKIIEETICIEEAGAAFLGNYDVYAMPDESPAHGNVGRQTVVNPDDGSVAGSPFGWHDTDGIAGADFTITRGNNAHAYEDGDNAGFSPDGGAALDFTVANPNEDFTVNTTYSNSDQSEAAAVVNIFYWSNIIHDILYVYGMDEAAGNFQQTNYSGNGFGNDYVRAEAQDGSGTCNANFSTPPDGSLPRMQMYVCNSRDGDFDNGVVVHEYGHGISIRLTGGGGNSGCLFGQEQMGEGWSDWYGLVLTLEPGDQGEDARGIGTWLTGAGPNGGGIRPQPYSTDDTTADGNPAINTQTYASINSAVAPHGVGSVWAEMLWEMTWGLIDVHGVDNDIYNFTGDVNQDAGNVQAMALVTEGLKLQPCGPGFVDGRDAIIAADEAIYGGANYCTIWTAFAKRGLGFSADQGSSSSKTDGTEAFDMPEVTVEVIPELCVDQGIQTYGDAFPAGGTFSGPGVTDNGDGMTYSFDPAAAGIGVHTITYTAPPLCGGSTTGTDSIEVTSAQPEIICQDTTVTLDDSGMATIAYSDVVQNLLAAEYVIDQSGTFAPEDITASGTTVTLGDDQISAALPVGFSFEFFGNAYSNFYISSNGFITFSPTTCGNCFENPIPTPGGIENLIAMVWEDLNPAAGGTIRYGLVGTAPDRKLVVSFSGVPYWNTSSFVTSQIQLHETTNRIEIHSTNVPQDGPATQGIENSDGSLGLATAGRNQQSWSATNDYVAYYLAPPRTADNCGSETTVTLSQDTFNCSDVGDNTITVTITDGNGNSNSCSATVTVNNGGASSTPIAVCRDITVQLDANGNANISAGDIDDGSSLCNGANPNLSLDTATFTCADVGTNTVTLTVDDGSGNTASCQATVTVEDTIAPAVVCQNLTVQLNVDGVATITADQVDSGSSDFCGIDTRSLDITSFDCNNIGSNTVTLTVTDINGNSNSCTAIVTVEDSVAPTVICQNITVALDDTGNATITAVQVDNGSSDSCGIAMMTLDITSFTCDNLGDNPVVLTITDANGNSNSCPVIVTVEDNTPLTVNGPGDQNEGTTTSDTTCETIVTYDPVTATDNCGEDQITIVQTAGLGSGELFPVGTTTEVYDITDGNGVVTTYSFDVVVTDETDPEITNCPDSSTETVEAGAAFTIPDYGTVVTYIDNCTTAPAFMQVPAPGVTVQAGSSTSVTLTVTDDAGNTATCSFNVAVEETLDVDEQELATSLVIYPNPTTDIVTIQYQGSQNLREATIIDVTGKVVRSQALQNGAVHQEFQISTLATGVYFVQVQSDTATIVKKLIVQ